MKVQEIMAKDPRVVTPGMPVREAARLMQSEDVGVLPVVEGEGSNRLVGILTDRDIAIRCVAEQRDVDTCRVQEVMSTRVQTARPDDDVDDVMEKMGAEQVRRIPIVDERDEVVGIVSQADVVRKARNEEKAEDTVERISQPGGKHRQ